MKQSEWERIKKEVDKIPIKERSYYITALSENGAVIVPGHFSKDAIANLFRYEIPEPLWQKFIMFYLSQKDDISSQVSEIMAFLVQSFKEINKEELKPFERKVKVEKVLRN